MRARALSYGVFRRPPKRCDFLPKASPSDFLLNAAPFLPSAGPATVPASTPRIIDCRVMADMEPELLVLRRSTWRPSSVAFWSQLWQTAVACEGVSAAMAQHACIVR